MEKNILTGIKAAVTAFFAALTARLGILAYPVYVLVALNITDYITGYYAAPYRGEERNSKKGFQGIVKKLFMLALVGIGIALDWLLLYTVNTVGIELPFNFLVAALVAVWLICNEIISILENIGDVGVDLPPFLLKLVKWVKAAAEDKADIQDREEG